jgi:hypothetical protein
MKSGNLNFLEPSGPLQAFNGTALPFYSNQFYENLILKLLASRLSNKFHQYQSKISPFETCSKVTDAVSSISINSLP